ncbi:hypothetical protein Cni_G11428 [Canna indica]|uniref:Uncharacterized protein n=1 Tax=Canna indica TaxID=4628 RepID=A0AAQ3K6L8_9LILI|nr:hypothetical protein Cni_G11428 [Canna indica]
MDAGKLTSSSSSSLLLLILLLSLTFSPPVRGDEEVDAVKNSEGQQRAAKQQQEPQPVERAIGMGGFSNRWDAIRTWAKLAWMSLRPPDLTKGYGRSESSAGVVKEAASRSMEESKETLEQTAKSAAEALHETKEKAKTATASSKQAGSVPDGEL